MAHTQGRWKRAGTSVVTQDGGLIASVYDGGDYSAEACGERQHKHKTAAANAQLIEAAPDMLEALKKVVKESYVSENTDGGPVAEMSADVLDVLRDAIAKAEGRS